jgi:hypothetical protein
MFGNYKKRKFSLFFSDFLFSEKKIRRNQIKAGNLLVFQFPDGENYIGLDPQGPFLGRFRPGSARPWPNKIKFGRRF